MAKSARPGDNRGRRAADRRHVPQEGSAATPESSSAPQVQQPPALANDQAATVRSAVSAATSRKRRGATKEQIATRAYELYLARGGTHGYDIEDWLQAERELNGE